MTPIEIREEQPGDAAAIREVNRQAFETDLEADLVDLLRERCLERLSLVARIDGAIVGHILFTPAVARVGEEQLKGMGLAPMAVRPAHQRQGVGTALVRRGMDLLSDAGCPFVIVLGHPEYYPRFGFERASDHGLRSEFEGVPDDAFMIAVLDEDVMQGAAGVVTYRPEFSETA